MNQRPTKIWLSTPHMGGTELSFIEEAFRDNKVMPLGPHVDGFEEDLSSFLGENRFVAALNTGTAALHLALIQAGVRSGEVVICQSMTFAASVNPVVYLGAKPVFVDSEKKTWNMSPDCLLTAIEECLKKGKKPKAIVVVDLYGMPAQYDKIETIAQQFDITLIEDAAEALGASYKGRKCGTFGQLAILSFNGNKIITTSGGGALVCKTSEEAEFARFLATQARDKASHYQHSHIGYNYRMSNISAGIGRGQMQVLPERINARRAVHSFYKKAFSGLPGIRLHEEPEEEYFSNHWLSCILVDPSLTGGVSRETIRLALLGEGIESRPLWKPMHLQPVFSACPFYGDGTSEQLFKQGLCLPSSSCLTEEELLEIAEVIISLMKNVKTST